MYGKRRNPNIDAMSEDIQRRYGVLIGNTEIGEILGLKSPTAIIRWVKDHGIMPSGRRGRYYARDVAKALIENGGVV